MCVRTQHTHLSDLESLRTHAHTSFTFTCVWAHREFTKKNDHTLLTVKMRRILIQVFGFLISTLGWLFVSCTTAMDYWRIIYVGGKGGNWMIKASWYWSNLWRDCMTDTSSVTNCRDYDVLWSVTRKSTLI